MPSQKSFQPNVIKTIYIVNLCTFLCEVIHRFVLPLLGGKAITRGLVVKLTSPRLASQMRLNMVFSSTSSASVANSEEL